MQEAFLCPLERELIPAVFQEASCGVMEGALGLWRAFVPAGPSYCALAISTVLRVQMGANVLLREA